MNRRALRNNIESFINKAIPSCIDLYSDNVTGTFSSHDGIKQAWLNPSESKCTIEYKRSKSREIVTVLWYPSGESENHNFNFSINNNKHKLLKEINKIFKPCLIKFKNIQVEGYITAYKDVGDMSNYGEIKITGDIEVLFSRNALKATIKNLAKFLNDSWSAGIMCNDGTRLCRIQLNKKVMLFIERYNLQKEFHNEVLKYCKNSIRSFSLKSEIDSDTYILQYVTKHDVVKILDK